MSKHGIVLVALYRYRNFPVRIMHSVLKNTGGVEPSTIFFKNCDTNIFNPPTDREEKLFAGIISDLNPKIVGFSVLSPYVPVAKRLTMLVRANSSSSVIWGGIHPTIFPESCIDEADMLCVGEGEGAMAELAGHLSEGRPFQSIKNLWIKSDGRVIKNPMRPLIQDLDSVPFPSYGDSSYYFIDSDSISKEDPLITDDEFWVQASRGCPYACSYCVNSLLQPLFKDLGPYTRRRSVDNIIREIRGNLSLPKPATKRVFFVDEVFGNEGSWLDEFEKRYKKDVGVPFYAEFNPKVLNASVLDRLVSAGLDTINFGIQTGSDHIRNRIFHRPGKNDEIIGLARETADRGLKITYDLIINNPYDTVQSLESTVDFLLKLPKPLFFNLYSLQYFPNYPLTMKAAEDGHIKPEEADADTLLEKTTREWAYVPRLFPYNKRQKLQNIIWLIVWNRAKEEIVRFSVFGDSLFSGLALEFLNLKSVVLGRLFGVGGLVSRRPAYARLINALGYIFKGDLKMVYCKIKKRL